VSLSTMQRVTTTAPFTVSGYFPIGASLTAYEVDGSLRLLLAGGSSTADYFQNFHPVARTFLFDPMASLSLGEPTVVATDFHGFGERADNVRMARAADGALHLTYTRALNAPDDHDWFSFTRSRNAAGDWQPEVRTERFPDSNTANSILVDSDGLLHHGFTFIVGAFHTTSADGGASWTSPIPVRDGGWGFWDWDSQLAQANGSVFAVFRSCHGWEDFPANVMLREWQADTGWGGPVWLTTLPNEDAMGTGAGSPRFQTRPDGNGVVVYTESLAAVSTRTKLLDVSLPHGVTVSHDVSASGRWAQGGDVAVDSDGVAHLVWQEADAAEGPYELWYCTWDPVAGLSAPLRVTTPAEASVRTATVGAYPGGRVLVAYGLKGGASEYGGVFLRKIAGTPSAAQMVGSTANAHSPCLRSTWDMADPNIVDLAWVEVYTWGSQLLHQEFPWAQLVDPETAAVTITSNWANATFTLSGPVSGTFTLVDGVWSLPNLPAGVYTIVWHAVPGQATPPPRTFVVSGDGEVTVGDSYIDENLHRVILGSSPSGTGAVGVSPEGTLLLGGQRAFADGNVTFRAIPIEGFTFVGWRYSSNQGSQTSTGHPLVLDIDRDYEVVAEFEPGGPFRVDTALSGEGTITPGAMVAAGGRFECAVTPAAGQQVQEILLDGVSQTLGQNVVVDPVMGTHTIQAITGPITAEVIASWMPEEGGQVVVPEEIVLNQNAAITAQPAAGFRFVEWRGDASGTQASINLLVDGAKSVTAVFALDGARGDLNDDGAISIEDAVLARRMFANEIPVNLARADMDASGALAPADLAAILQAEARRDRPSLGAQPVTTSGDKRQVSFPNGIALTLPGGWPTAPTQVTAALLAPGLLPPLPPSLQALTPVYDIRLVGHGDFGREIGIEIPLDNATGTVRLLYLDPDSNSWVTLPTRYEAGGRAGGTSYGSARRSGNYLVAQTNGVMNAVQGTHCLVHNDPAVAHQLGGGALAAPEFAVVVADAVDLGYAAYRAAGYD
ncbi:MAG: hypothetical protein RBU25_19285, partial [Lentisphaeria bacterium]|nr:hypothetical protein [Lentisphaeria bacterium]